MLRPRRSPTRPDTDCSSETTPSSSRARPPTDTSSPSTHSCGRRRRWNIGRILSGVRPQEASTPLPSPPEGIGRIFLQRLKGAAAFPNLHIHLVPCQRRRHMHVWGGVSLPCKRRVLEHYSDSLAAIVEEKTQGEIVKGEGGRGGFSLHWTCVWVRVWCTFFSRIFFCLAFAAGTMLLAIDK